MRRASLLLAALAVGIAASCAQVEIAQAETAECATVTEEDVAGLFERWNTSLATLDPAKVAANYQPDAVLLPTMSNTTRTDPAAIQDYFKHFLEKHPKGVIKSRTIRIGCNTVSDVGTYTFLVDGQTPGKQDAVPARYSFIYTYRDGRWLISHHHSSAMPERVTTATATPKE